KIADVQKRKDRGGLTPEQAEKAVEEILDAKQKERVRQILLQDARRRGREVLPEPSVAESLKLDDDQKERIRAIRDNAAEVGKLRLTEYRGLFTVDDETRPVDARIKGIAATVEKIRDDARKKSEGALSRKQKERFAELLGTPFAGKIERPKE